MRTISRLLIFAALGCSSSGDSTSPTPTGSTPNPTPTTPVPDPRLGTSQLNVVYCTAGTVPLRLDVYYPTQSPPAGSKWPLIVYIHGGELIEGDKVAAPGSPTEAWKNTLATRGYVFASINYRLGPTFRFPAMIEDAKCAIRYFRANAATPESHRCNRHELRRLPRDADRRHRRQRRIRGHERLRWSLQQSRRRRQRVRRIGRRSTAL